MNNEAIFKTFQDTDRNKKITTEQLGERVYNDILDDTLSVEDLGNAIYNVFKNCSSMEQFIAANNMLIAVCGYSVDSIIGQITECKEECR